MRKSHTLVLLSLLFIASGLQAQVKFTRKLKKTLTIVDTTAIRERIIYLADDKLLGRKPGTTGYQMAVDYAIGQFKSIGIGPKGDNGYLQTVVIRVGRLDTTGSSFTVRGQRFRHGQDIVLYPNMNNASAEAMGTLVWAGYGISAPHLNHDDYAGLDVKGKVVVVRDGTPGKFPASEMAHFNNFVSKGEIAAQRGAVGILLVLDQPQMVTAASNSFKGMNGFVNRDGSVGSGRMSVHPALKFTGAIALSAFRKIVTDAKPLSAQPADLGVPVTAATRTLYRDITSYNVVGWIEGTDPRLKQEFVIHTAHLDHIGITKSVKGDSINNGAHDNASGTACAIEIAKLYKKLPPRRSVLVALVTAEEMGLLGSRYLAANPPVPKENIVADVNTDMPTLLAPLLSIEPLGAQHSTLMNEVKRAAGHLGLEVHEDHMPEQVRFVRSDQYSFIREGIPALHVKYGLKTNDPKVDLRKVIDVWTEAHYHKPSDEFSDAAFDFTAAATYVRLNFLIGWQVAMTDGRPQWVKGDFFGETFGKER